MGYLEALEAAGCKVIEFKEFGSYQGTWLAIVEYNGERGIVEGAYGSCSHCDAFEAEFGYSDKPTIEDGKYYRNRRTWDDESICTEEEYNEAMSAYNKKLSDFGAGYLAGGLYDKAHYEKRLAKINDSEDWFDEEEKDYCQWAVNTLQNEAQ